MGISSKHWAFSVITACTAALTLLPAGTSQAASGTCFPNSINQGATYLSGDSTKAVTVQQAANTWSDWVWRGTEFLCPSQGEQLCRYDYTKSHTTTTAWTGSISVEAGPISATPGYEHYNSYTDSETFSVTLNPGQTAQPIQIVNRRWTQGNFEGAYVKQGATCSAYTSSDPRHPGQSVPGVMYVWNPTVRWGNWTENQAVNSLMTYAINGKV
jgi:hypothetical protein